MSINGSEYVWHVSLGVRRVIVTPWPVWVDYEWRRLLVDAIMREWQSPFGHWYADVIPRWPSK